MPARLTRAAVAANAPHPAGPRGAREPDERRHGPEPGDGRQDASDPPASAGQGETGGHGERHAHEEDEARAPPRRARRAPSR